MQAHRFTCGLLLKGDEVAGLYNVVVLPALYLVGDDGHVVHVVHAEYGYRGEGRVDTDDRRLP